MRHKSVRPILYIKIDYIFTFLLYLGCACPFWAAAPKGRCPVGHRGEFQDVHPSVRPSVHTPPGHQSLNSAVSGLILALLLLLLHPPPKPSLEAQIPV